MAASHPQRKLVRHYEGQRHLHELTFSTFRRMPLLTSNPWRKILAGELDAACEAEGFQARVPCRLLRRHACAIYNGIKISL